MNCHLLTCYYYYYYCFTHLILNTHINDCHCCRWTIERYGGWENAAGYWEICSCQSSPLGSMGSYIGRLPSFIMFAVVRHWLGETLTINRGYLQEHVNEIDFEYMEYARQRFQQYWLMKPKLLGSEWTVCLYYLYTCDGCSSLLCCVFM